jgi:hypothetical protein
MMADHERLIFTDLKFNYFPDARCRAEVELTRRSGDHVIGTREGKGTEVVALRCAAQAAMDAIQKVVEPERSFELLGVKSVHAFDTVIVIVCVGVTDAQGHRQLVGTFVADRGPERAAAVAVLNATNRYLASDMITRL